MPVGGTRRERTVAGAGHAHRIEKFTNKLGDLIGIKPAQVKQHYRVCLDTGSRSDKGHRRSLLSACLITACEAEADVLDRACGVRGEYRFGRKKASEIVESEEDCPRSGAFMYAGVRVGNAGNVGEQICYRVHFAGTRVPDAKNVGEQTCYRVQYVGTHLLPGTFSGYTCTRRRERRVTILLAGTICGYTCSLLFSFFFSVCSGVPEASGSVPRLRGDRGLGGGPQRG